VTRADPSRRREQPTSWRCSVDESVVSIAVASESTPDPSMGFVPLQGPLALRSSLVHARTGERRRAEARDALDAGPVFEADASTVGIPPTIAPRDPRRPTRGWNDAEVRDEPGGRSRLRAARLFSAPSEARDRAPHPLVRPKPSSRAGKCRRSLSGGEVVSPWTAMRPLPRSSTRGWETGGGGAPWASSPTFMGFFDVKERSEERLLGRSRHNCVWPHASLRQALAEPVPTNGSGSAKVWWPCTPAMAAGLTDHVWDL
jgi:hypothetical protein